MDNTQVPKPEIPLLRLLLWKEERNWKDRGAQADEVQVS
jgi:hypothetical protein